MDIAIKKQLLTVGYIERFWENSIKIGKDKVTRTYLATRLELLETYWSRFLDAHDQILSFENVDASEYIRKDIYGATEDNYVAVKSRIVSIMPPAKLVDSAVGKSDASSVLKQIQLPKISLPTFNGNQLAWEGFRDLFKSLVYDVDGLTPTQKLQYLRASLTGEAAAIVANIEITTEGYALAWDELVSRYDNRSVLMATHMRLLLSSTPIVKSTAAEIGRLLSTANQAARSFQALKGPVEHWDDWFVHILVDKLDHATRLLWESFSKSNQDFPTFEDLKYFLLTRAKALDAAGPRASLPAFNLATPKKTGRRDDVSSHATSTGNDEGKASCPVCKERHTIRTCARFKACTADQRREQVRKKKVCFNCLGQGHLVGSFTVRALLDSGSEASFVSERVVQQLRLARKRVNVTVSGLQDVTTGKATQAVALMIGSDRSPSLRIALPRALVLAKLTTITPGKRILKGDWPYLKGLQLAILGVDVMGMILENGIKRGPIGEPTAQQTVFGWVLMGLFVGPADALPTGVNLEEMPAAKIFTPEKDLCEQLFEETDARDHQGRYIVHLPRKRNPSIGLGASRPGALQQLLTAERYHMEPVPDEGVATGEVYYMPHHAVIKATDPPGKIRVVFNSFFGTSTGVSLNETLLPGPRLQMDLWLVLSRWRLVHGSSGGHPPATEVKDFRLTTVTYGTTSAPYLAIRTLQQLVLDEGERFPLGASVIRSNIYVDDVLAGANTMEKALKLRQQIVDILAAIEQMGQHTPITMSRRKSRGTTYRGIKQRGDTRGALDS
ncbi:uncharacterized protein LOC114942698 [Nylanderia fulva]|uniref:uncharacterized protein LOC114942698 n=1 Tax=Nylanderia fulva TaxID=613905 RepID=UPI0010FAE5A0|nr:uncharacterized protein LOC114942698 [Nylanderia fulva]